jgi:hypothetical protein
VLSRAERGSKLNDPMNTWVSSTENVFSCRLVFELPRILRNRCPAFELVRFISWSATPARSSARRRFA